MIPVLADRERSTKNVVKPQAEERRSAQRSFPHLPNHKRGMLQQKSPHFFSKEPQRPQLPQKQKPLSLRDSLLNRLLNREFFETRD